MCRSLSGNTAENEGTRSENFTTIQGREFVNVQPSCCLDVVVFMLNRVFWRHIPLEIEFKSRGKMGSDGICTAVSPMSGSPTFDNEKK